MNTPFALLLMGGVALIAASRGSAGVQHRRAVVARCVWFAAIALLLLLVVT